MLRREKKDQSAKILFCGGLQHCLLYIKILCLICLSFGTSANIPTMDGFEERDDAQN